MSPVASTYEQAVEYLYGRINYERLTPERLSARDFKLERTERLLQLLGNPQQTMPVVHVAGTKGKGSTAAMVSHILTAAGFRVGLFTSPHISAFEERLTVNRRPPGAEELVALVNAVADAVALLERQSITPTFFEITTALAWLYFAAQRVDLAVLEVGLGGRLDSTNVCRPEVTIITNISYDHMHVLGSRLSQIAAEKAGIIKTGVPLVSGVLHPEARPVIEAAAARHSAPLTQLERDVCYRYRYIGLEAWGQTLRPAGQVDVETPRQCFTGLSLALTGAHQAANAAIAVAAIEQLSVRGWDVAREAVYSGLAQVQWPLRFEILHTHPVAVVDAAHNAASIAAVVETLELVFPERRRILVFGASQDKDARAMLEQLFPRFAAVVLTEYQNNPRAMPLERLVEVSRSLGQTSFQTAPNTAAAWQLAGAMAGPDDVICATGSFFIAAELRALLTQADRSSVGNALAV
jgi:dihydrofolate synthase/folylpolyglutamate synthase